MGFLSKLLTFGEGKQLKRYQSLVDKIGSLEPTQQALTDAELVALPLPIRSARRWRKP